MTLHNQSIRIICLVSLIVSGCAATSERHHPQFSTYRQSMGTLLVLRPEIRIFEQLPDGSRLFQDIQSQEAQRRAQTAIIQQLSERAFTVRTVDTKALAGSEYIDTTALFRSVNRSIQLHAFGSQPFPAKLHSFEYHLGPVANMLKASGADGLVMAIGYQSGAVAPEKNWLGIAVVEPEGRIIWYNLKGNAPHFNLQTPAGISALVACVMANFWEVGS